MADIKGSLKRFKNGPAGLLAFVRLIEQAGDKKREAFLKKAEAEDPEFARKAIRKVVLFEDIVLFEDGIIAEIMAKCPLGALAYALHGKPPEFRKKLSRQLGFREVKKLQDEEGKIGDKPHPHLVQGAERQIIKIARQLEALGRIDLELTDSPRLKTTTKAA